MPTKKRKPSFRAAIHVRKGAFHKWLGKKPDSPITAADIAKGEASNENGDLRGEFQEVALAIWACRTR
jgi:hypothetical protein